MSRNYEVEIKSLLGSKTNAEKLKKALHKTYPKTKLISKGRQLNHYFNIPSDIKSLKKNLISIIPKSKKDSFNKILDHGNKISLRTRDADGKVILVVKASLGDDTSSNGVKRVEFESEVKMTLNRLDKILLDSGATYQAKWSREREEYENGDIHVCIDKNAGYGYLAEFEKVIQDEKMLDMVKKELLSIMKKLGFKELSQDRLERMFSYYNAHWPEYYGTEKIFDIK